MPPPTETRTSAPVNQEQAIWTVLQNVPDPEVPAISVVELGIVRSVVLTGGDWVVTVTPTYSGCPAVEAINVNILAALQEAGISNARVESTISPPWTTDDITARGRRKLLAYGIAPPHGSASKQSLTGGDKPRACPLCGSTHTELLSQFGSTSCKALYRCTDCREPFDYFKCH